MSYFADHLAWQQRVAQEFKASSQFVERQSDFHLTQSFPMSINGGGSNGVNDLGYNTLYSGSKTQNDFRKSYNNHPLSQSNLKLSNEVGSVPAMNSNGNGAIITKKDMLRERSLNANSAAGKQSLIGIKQGLNPYSYVPRSRQNGKRSNTAGKYSATNNLVNRSQYQPLQQQQQLLQKSNQVQQQNTIDPQVPRFNENNFESLSVKKSQGPRSIISTHSKQNSRSIVNGIQRPGTQGVIKLNQSHNQGFNKQKILEAVERLSEKDLEKVSRILKGDNDDKNQADFQHQDEYQSQANYQDELNDRVEDLQQLDNHHDDKDETLSRMSRGTKYSGMAKSEISRLSNKTYIQHLQTELEEEKNARLKLEKELEELKRMSTEISTHLGLNKK